MVGLSLRCSACKVVNIRMYLECIFFCIFLPKKNGPWCKVIIIPWNSIAISDQRESDHGICYYIRMLT